MRKFISVLTCLTLLTALLAVPFAYPVGISNDFYGGSGGVTETYVDSKFDSLLDVNGEIKSELLNRTFGLHGLVRAPLIFQPNIIDNTTLDVSDFEVKVNGVHYIYPGGTALPILGIGTNGVLIAYDSITQDLEFIKGRSLTEGEELTKTAIGQALVNPFTGQIVAAQTASPEPVINKMKVFVERKIGTFYDTGAGIVTENATPFKLNMTAGGGNLGWDVRDYPESLGLDFYQINRLNPDPVKKTNVADTNYIPQYYIDVSLVQQPITNNWHVAHTLVHQPSSNSYYLVAGEIEYLSIDEARDAAPNFVPFSTYIGFATVAKIIVKGGDTNVFEIQELTPRLFGGSTGGSTVSNASSVIWDDTYGWGIGNMQGALEHVTSNGAAANQVILADGNAGYTSTGDLTFTSGELGIINNTGSYVIDASGNTAATFIRTTNLVNTSRAGIVATSDGGSAVINRFGSAYVGTRFGISLTNATQFLGEGVSATLFGSDTTAPIYFGSGNDLYWSFAVNGDATAYAGLAFSDAGNMGGTDASIPSKKYVDNSVAINPINTQTGTAYTLALTDAGGIVEMNNASPNTLTIPTNASVAFAVGTRIDIVQYGVGITTICGDTGVVVNGVSGGCEVLSGQYEGVSPYKRATNEWNIPNK